MAGRNPGFDGRQFRDAIRFVYNMAAPPDGTEQATFYRPSELVYNVNVDDDNVPFDPATTVQRVQPAPVKVACGIEYRDVDGDPLPFGTVTASKVVCSLLDEDYKLVQDASYVVIGGDKYLYQRTEPPSGLFDVGLYSMHFVAENET